jgi:bifunctional UDP-N-acetylglucosamine pyrophosphorylase/glucosamine-1-phosphate N-acetyltransferase
MFMKDKNKVAAVILAAGKGKRMKSDLPKVMHLLKGKPLIEYVWQNVANSNCFDEIVVVVPKDSNLVQDYLGDKAEYAIQDEQLGTGHAVLAAENILKNKAKTIVVFYGDMPYLQPDSIKKLIEKHRIDQNVLTFITVKIDNFDLKFSAFESYGRIIRDQNNEVRKVIEKKDCSEEELKIKEVNSGFYCFQAEWLWENLNKLKADNIQHEYYLTDLVEMAIEQGEKVETIEVAPEEALGINSPEDLNKARQILNRY